MVSQDNINVFEPDLLDRAVTGYEENVPLLAQIAAGFTPPGMAMDIVAAGKYGRDAARNIAEGDYGKAALYGGIAGLSALGAVPILGDLARGPKSVLKQMMLRNQGIRALDEDILDLNKVIQDPKLSNAEKNRIIKNHPAIMKAEKEMNAIPQTSELPMYNTDEFMDNRLFNFGGKTVQGYKAAVDELYEGGKTLAYREMGLTPPSTIVRNTDEKIANILIGPPAAGKSAVANPLAIKYNATIIDPDEAKKVLPEFAGGLGGNAVHKESKYINNFVLEKAIDAGDNLLIPTIGARPDKIRNSIFNLQNKGYKVNLVLTDLDPDLALVRMADRFVRKGRLIGQDQANLYKGQSNKTYDILKKEDVADGYGKIDTTTRLGEPKEIYEDTARIFEDAGI